MISVLTVNYFSSDQLRDLAASLREHPCKEPVELIVTNNSTEDRVELHSDSRLTVRIVDSANVGFGRGINRAFVASEGETVFVANPDVRVTRGALDAACECLRSRPDIGVLLPMLRYPGGAVQLSVRRFYTWPMVLWARSPLRALGRPPAFFREYLCEDMDRTGPSDVDWGLGAAMFLRREDILGEQIFDDRFFMYFEDVDLCYRTWLRRLRVVYDPRIECVHAHRRSSRNPFSLAGLRHMRSLWLFMMKHGGLPQRPGIE